MIVTAPRGSTVTVEAWNEQTHLIKDIQPFQYSTEYTQDFDLGKILKHYNHIILRITTANITTKIYI